MKRFGITSWLAAGTLAAIMSAGTAAAAPIGVPDSVAAARGRGVILVHEGCHYDNRFSPRFGWHNHSNADCRPEPARRYQREVDPRGGYGRGGHDGGHPCHYDCRYSPGLGWHNHSNAQCRPEPCGGR